MTTSSTHAGEISLWRLVGNAGLLFVTYHNDVRHVTMVDGKHLKRTDFFSFSGSDVRTEISVTAHPQWDSDTAIISLKDCTVEHRFRAQKSRGVYRKHGLIDPQDRKRKGSSFFIWKTIFPAWIYSFTGVIRHFEFTSDFTARLLVTFFKSSRLLQTSRL